MYSIPKATLKTILLTVSLTGGLMAYNIAVGGGGGTFTPPPPMIVKTVVDVKEGVLIITGRYFGTTSPTVTLSDQPLAVKHFSEREVVAYLPRDITAATYGVTVITSGWNQANSNIFSAMLPGIGKK